MHNLIAYIYTVKLGVTCISCTWSNRYKILCTRNVSGITIIRYAQNRTIGKSNGWKFTTKYLVQNCRVRLNGCSLTEFYAIYVDLEI